MIKLERERAPSRKFLGLYNTQKNVIFPPVLRFIRQGRDTEIDSIFQENGANEQLLLVIQAPSLMQGRFVSKSVNGLSSSELGSFTLLVKEIIGLNQNPINDQRMTV